MNLQGATVVVTGGGSGLGEATARRFAACGAQVAVIDLSAEAALRVAALTGGLGLAADVSDCAAMATAFAAVEKAYGSLHVCVTCAGIGPSRKILSRDLDPQPLASFNQVIDVNLKGTFNAMRLAAASMAKGAPDSDGARGVIVMTASIAGYEGQIGQAAYAASKAGVIGLTLPAARELARYGIRVVSIAPGVFRTPMFDTVAPEWQASITEGIPFPKRAGDVDEFARLVEAVATNPMINGTTIRIDGAVRLA
jgi:NAD(P)-dependent dehydrogenase (short-subunit alcohol dehydrogenase family)